MSPASAKPVSLNRRLKPRHSAGSMRAMRRSSNRQTRSLTDRANGTDGGVGGSQVFAKPLGQEQDPLRVPSSVKSRAASEGVRSGPWEPRKATNFRLPIQTTGTGAYRVARTADFVVRDFSVAIMSATLRFDHRPRENPRPSSHPALIAPRLRLPGRRR